MNKPKCELDCEIEGKDEKDVCCYWCNLKYQCSYACKNLDCKAEKEMSINKEG